MNENYEQIEISINDRSISGKVQDKFGNYPPTNIEPAILSRNEVVLDVVDIKKKEKIDERRSKNLVLMRGRSWLMRRAINMELGMDSWEGEPHTYPASNMKDSFFSWFAFGSGGHYENDILKTKSIKPTEYDLNIWAKNISDEEIIFADSTVQGNILYYKVSSGYDIVWQQYHKISGVEFLSDYSFLNTETYLELDSTDPYNEYRVDSFLRAHLFIVIEPYEYNFVNSNYNGQILSEAAIFVSDSRNSVPSQKPVIFAKTNFSPVVKDPNRKLILHWYLYF